MNSVQNQSQISYDELTRIAIECSMEVHRALGNGFQEVVYQRALAVELELNNIIF